MKEKYESLSLATLKDLAKARGLKGTSAMRKAKLIEVMLEQDEKDKAAKEAQNPGNAANSMAEKAEKPESRQNGQADGDGPGGDARESENLKSSSNETHRAESAKTAGHDMDDDQKHTETDQAETVRTPQRRKRIPEGITRPSYDRNNGERRTYERSKVHMVQNGSSASRRNYGEQGVSGNRRNYAESGQTFENQRSNPASGQGSENRRNYAESNQGSENRRNYAESNQGSESRRSYTESNQGSENRRNYGEPNQMSENRRSYAESGQASENHRNYVESGQEPENRRSYTEPGQASEDRRIYSGDGGPTEQPSRNAAGEVRLQDIDRPPAELSQLDSGQSVSGILEVMPDGYGFIRSDNYLPGDNDVYVSPSQIRRFNLKTGDIISGNTRIKSQQEKFSALLYLMKINELPPSEAMRRSNFEDMTPIFPNERLRLERDPRGTAMRIVDLFSPIGKGQRGMIVSPPKAGKTTLLKDIARSLLKNCPKMRILILLIDERPEEVTDIKEAIRGENVEVIYSTFDETPEHHKRVSEMVIERAKRLVEQKEDVIILLDSITRLARAYNLTVPPSGRTLSGGLDPAALHMPKRFFGAARNMREGGSLTILATALVDTGSKMDDVVYEEFKGTGNMELVLDRKLSERRVFPAIDIPKSGTRREDLLLDREEQEAMYYMRRALNGMKSDDAVESILNLFLHTRDNHDLVTRVRRQKGV
ncbi:MAG: transcription termination factor Rho [Lachnospiraceae bacterium]|nr:transcription termination factor Rho [Lachnospiraceae bacterium]